MSEFEAIYEWCPDQGHRNFGDHLVWLIGTRVFRSEEWERLKAETRYQFVLLGSFIVNFQVQSVLRKGRRPVLVGCGYRGEALAHSLLEQAIFLGCRGKHTAEALSSHGFDVAPIGDPAMLLPLLVRRGRRSGKAILVPHIADENRESYKAEDAGCDLILQPQTRDLSDLVEMVRAISSARFVLAGAMHAAIVAHAYGVPFAFFRKASGHLDCPPKWDDWLSSVSDPYVPASFFDNAVDGKRWHDTCRPQLFRNRYLPILDAYSNIGGVRPWIALKAAAWDAYDSFTALMARQPGWHERYNRFDVQEPFTTDGKQGELVDSLRSRRSGKSSDYL